MASSNNPPSPAQKKKSRAQAGMLYAKHSEELLAFFRSWAPISRVDATELLNHVFIELIQWFDNNPDQTLGKPRAFLYTLARRHTGKFCDRLRRTPTAQAAAGQLDDLELSSDALAYDVEYMAGVSEGHRVLLRAMRRLSDAELQMVTYLRFWAGMTEGEISDVLGITRGKVTRRLRKVKVELQRLLQEIERAEPGSTRTSTTILARWWKKLSAEVDGMARDDADPPAGEGGDGGEGDEEGSGG